MVQEVVAHVQVLYFVVLAWKEDGGRTHAKVGPWFCVDGVGPLKTGEFSHLAHIFLTEMLAATHAPGVDVEGQAGYGI